jgi:two-component system LytT family response regulator
MKMAHDIPNTRVLIVDDEPPARLRLRELLQRRDRVEIAGECSSGPEAVAALARLRPDLLFLDVQMPAMDGFQVLRESGAACTPVTIFVTAYDRYALNAFEAHALDYLLKPFSDERFDDALTRALEHLQTRRSGELAARVLQLLERGEGVSRIAVKTDGRVLIVQAGEIDWVEAAGVYVELHVGKKHYLHRVTLSELEEQLAPARFVRIHRSILVNLERIRELSPRTHGDYSVLLRDGTELRLSRSYREQLGALLGYSF